VPRPALWDRLAGAARVTMVAAPSGSGKSVLLRSWISAAGLEGRVAWVSVGRDERDPQRFWLSVVGALRGTTAGAALARELTAAPDVDGWVIVERLLEDLTPLADQLWLVLDDLHELGSAETHRQLELLVMRAPADLRFVFATRRDVRLGLHRLRLEGELTEIREGDLRFSLAEARDLLEAAGVRLTESALARLVDRTEGWAAGLRLAALSLAGHPDPEQFAAEFSGSERTVAEYLLAEVLERQSEQVRLLLLRTSVLDRVNGELADLLTDGSGGERMLQDLEGANAFVVSLDAARSWFRYHRLFAGLLQLELRRTEPDALAALHSAAAAWFAGHGYPVEAIRHAQAARDWPLAARLLSDHWPSLYLDGRAATVHALLTGFPSGEPGAGGELAALAAADELAQGSLEAAELYLEQAERGLASVPVSRRGQAQVMLVVVRLLLARQRGNLPAVVGEAQRLQDLAEAPVAGPGLGGELRALALVSLGISEYWAHRMEQARQHLEQGVALARRIGRPYLEFTGLAWQAPIETVRSDTDAAERARQALELAHRHGWTADPAACNAYITLGAVLAWQGRLEEAEPWAQLAERTLRPETEPTSAIGVYHLRGTLELASGRLADAVTACQAAERLAEHLAVTPGLLPMPTRAYLLQALARLGETKRAEQVLAELGGHEREPAEMRVGVAAVRLAQDDPSSAIAVLAPVLDGSILPARKPWQVEAFMLAALAREALGDQAAAGRTLEHALDLAEPDGLLGAFLMYPAPGLLERHVRGRTAHTAMIAEIRRLLAGDAPAPSPARPLPLLEPLSKSEIRVLRYLPTHMSAPQIADELHVAQSTVKTHMRNLYAKLGAHSRAEAVGSARAQGLLAPATYRP